MMPKVNRRSPDFKEKHDSLPPEVQAMAAKAFANFKNNPNHPALNVKPLYDNKKASHSPGSFSVRVNSQYRSIYVEIDGVCVWYWTGSHSDYNKFTGNSG
jgi:plasmid maintenance system killer protein